MVIAIAGLLTALSTTSAFAGSTPLPPPQSGSVNVSGTVNAAITLSFTGLSPSISFPAVYAGSSTRVDNAENYTIETSDPNGFTLSITPSAAYMSDSGGDQLPNSNLMINETGGASTATINFTGATPQTFYSGGQPGNAYGFQEAWNETVPGNQPAGNYSESFTYLAMGQ
jgi:hypothetical protein